MTEGFTDPTFLAQVRRIGEPSALLGTEAFRRFWEDRAITMDLLSQLPRN